jgi:hypothetical protein
VIRAFSLGMADNSWLMRTSILFFSTSFEELIPEASLPAVLTSEMMRSASL